jgi:mRNA interferase MazF
MKMMKYGQAIYNQGDIVLVRFPFSDLSSSKIRPVLIISNDSYNQKYLDVVVCGITSNLHPTDYSIFIDQNDLEMGLLKSKSKIKVDAITALEKSIFLKTIGKIKTEIMKQVKDNLLKLIDYTNKPLSHSDECTPN